MPDLCFQVTHVEPEAHAAVPTLQFTLEVTDRPSSDEALTQIHSVLLHGQVRIEPARRHYTTAEQQRLRDLFGTPDRWGQTLRPMVWAHVDLVIPSFSGSRSQVLSIPCSADFNLAATKYFEALESGSVPLCFLFSGTVFYEAGEQQGLQVSPISWEKEAYYSLPASTWRAMMDQHYPDIAWLYLRRDSFDRLHQYKQREGLVTWEQTIDRLLQAVEEAITS